MKVLTVRNSEGDTRRVAADKVVQAERDGYIPVVTDGREERRVAFDKIHMAKQDGFLPLENVEPPGMLEQAGKGALKVIGEVGKFVDSYTGAPVRSAIGAYQDDQSIVDAYAGQLGRNPDMAPTGKEIAQKAGVGEGSLSDAFPQAFTDDDNEADELLKFKKGGPADITKSGAAGLAIDIAADPTNLIPGKAVGKGVELVGKGAKYVAKGVGTVTKIAASPVLDKAADILKATTVNI